MGEIALSRSLSNALLAEMYSQTSSVPFLFLLTLSHSSFSTIYLVNNTEDIVSRGNTHSAFPMRITPPLDDGQSSNQMSLRLDNVSLELIDELRSVTDRIDVKVELVLASAPDIVEIEYGELKMSNVQYNAQNIQANLVLDDFLNTALTSEKYDPANYPGLFA